MKVGTFESMMLPPENNPGGTYHRCNFTVSGKSKQATINVAWLMKNGKIVGSSITMKGGKGFGELLSILAAVYEKQTGK
jgi:hypothetical protein